MLLDANIAAAQGRVAALLAVGSHGVVRALASHTGVSARIRDLAREMAGAAMRVEQLATRVFETTPKGVSRADDVAVVRPGPGPVMLPEAIDQWAREARDTVRSATPSARDLQGVAGDLSRLATHSRAIVRASVGDNLITREQGARIDNALAESAAGWLEVAERWMGLHTAQPPTPSKIATSHALGLALTAVTRDGLEWAAPAVMAERVDLFAVMAAVRRAGDVAQDVAERQNDLPERLAASGQVFAPAVVLAPWVVRLHARLRGDLVETGVGDITDLAGQARRQFDSARVAARLLDGAVRLRTPTMAKHTPSVGSTGLALQ